MVTDGVAFVTTRTVLPGHDQDYRDWGEKVQGVVSKVPGFLSFEQLPAIPGQQDFWTQIVKFEDRATSQAWATSAELSELLVEVEPFTRQSEVAAVRTGDRDWLNFGLSTKAGPGAPTKWKQLITGIMALYPTVIIAHELLSMLITVPFALSTLLTNAIAMSLVMLVWLPQLSKLLRNWLIPATPLPLWKTVSVAVAILAVIAVWLVVFSYLFNA